MPDYAVTTTLIINATSPRHATERILTHFKGCEGPTAPTLVTRGAFNLSTEPNWYRSVSVDEVELTEDPLAGYLPVEADRPVSAEGDA